MVAALRERTFMMIGWAY